MGLLRLGEECGKKTLIPVKSSDSTDFHAELKYSQIAEQILMIAWVIRSDSVLSESFTH